MKLTATAGLRGKSYRRNNSSSRVSEISSPMSNDKSSAPSHTSIASCSFPYPSRLNEVATENIRLISVTLPTFQPPISSNLRKRAPPHFPLTLLSAIQLELNCESRTKSVWSYVMFHAASCDRISTCIALHSLTTERLLHENSRL
jgi:hypothetical protein